MARPAKTVSDEVWSRARGLDSYIKRVESLHDRNLLSRSDIERAYSGAFLELYSFVEGAIERLFLGLLVGRLEPPNVQVKALVTIQSDQVASKVVNGGRNYVDWLPYDLTIKRAEAFFSRGLPFTGLESQHKNAFEDAGVLRNVLAHSSSHAARKFDKRFLESRAVPLGERRPSAFLRGDHTIGQTRFSFYGARLSNAVERIASWAPPRQDSA